MAKRNNLVGFGEADDDAISNIKPQGNDFFNKAASLYAWSDDDDGDNGGV